MTPPTRDHSGLGRDIRAPKAVLVTLYLLSIPGMRESIREGMATPLDETSEEPGW